MAPAQESGGKNSLTVLSERVLAGIPATVRRVDIDLHASQKEMHHHAGEHDIEEDLADSGFDWERVSSALRALHAATQQEFEDTTMQLAMLDTEVQQQLHVLSSSATEEGGDVNTVDEKIQTIHFDVNDLLGDLQESESHFRDVASLVAPSMQKLQRLEARAAYFQAALEVETRSQEAKTQAIRATSDALGAFTAFAAFVHTLPREYTHIRVRCFFV